MKYGIITHYDVHNHGALLQLNALKQVLKLYGIDAQALQFDKNYDFMGREMKAKYDISFKSIGIYIKYFFEKGLKCFVYNFKKKKILDQYRSSANLIGDYYTECSNLNGVIVGSDEVFALHTGPTPAFLVIVFHQIRFLLMLAVLVRLRLMMLIDGMLEHLFLVVWQVCVD